MHRYVALFFCLGVLVTSTIGVHAVRQTSQTIDVRDRFALELPEVSRDLNLATNSLEVRFPTSVAITRLKVWLLNPYAERVKYGGLKASLNNKSLGIVSEVRSGSQGKFIDIGLGQNPDFQLVAGKNVLEVTALDDAGVTYRCMFVLLPGANQPPSPVMNTIQIRIEHNLAPEEAHAPKHDRQAPVLTLFEPKTVLTGASSPLSVRITGEVSDDSGVIVAVTANGKRIAASPPPKPRDKKDKTPPPDPASLKVPFDQTVTVEPNARALLIEAQDPTGNRTLITVPVMQPVVATAKGVEIRKYAVIVGVSDYRYNEGGLSDLSFADKDAEALHEFLKTPNGGGFKSDEVICLTNSQATLAAVEAAINRYLTKAGPNDLIYLFLAGHGAPDPFNKQSLYFLLHDSKVLDMPNTAYPMRRIGEFLDQQRKQVRLLAFFDTCHSAGITRPTPTAVPSSKARGKNERGVGSQTTAQTNQAPKVSLSVGKPSQSPFNFYDANLFQQKDWTVIASAGANELSQESSDWRDAQGRGHGVFTWALLEGAEGKGDTNGDCQVTAAELFNYIQKTVSLTTGRAQNPQSLPGSKGDLVVARVVNPTTCAAGAKH